ncbi:TonB-dependent receptor [Sphingobium sp. H39-3-25]|uniref:TonB-dependent receptor n=1 Tax=Sphingobium arseniciresistens TaxID=3030834 RepID=UPI0023B92C78|nr:TonB-dependent receptor [Sphingobium arseniciresistens]
MGKARSAVLVGLMLGAAPSALQAQAVRSSSQQGSAAQELGDEEIVVTGERERGAVVGTIKPEQQLSPADVRSYGVTSISELVSALAPQTNAAGGTPVILLNGKRISSFSEIQDIPTEAIARVDILPEEVSLSYGYSASQKVVNIVLRQRFRAYSGEVRGGTTTDGGRENGTLNATVLRIRNDNRFTLDIKYSAADSLKESERDIIPTAPSNPYSLLGNIVGLGTNGEIDPALSTLVGSTVTTAAVPASAASGRPALSDFVAGANTTTVDNLGRYRTLSPSTSNLAINSTLARALGGVSASLNGRVELINSDSLQGLPSATMTVPAGNPYSPFAGSTTLYRYLDQAGPLGQSVRGVTGHVGLTLNGQLNRWQWSLTSNYDYSESKTRTDRGFDLSDVQAALNAGDASVNPYAELPGALLTARPDDRARGKTSAATADLLMSGPLFDLPAGPVTSSVTLSGSTNSFESSSLRSGLASSAEFTRNIGGGQANVDIPLTSRRQGVLSAIGDVAINGNVAVKQLSDAGTLTTIGYGLRWTPIPQVRLIASMTDDQQAATGQQINNPLVVTPNVSVFDYATGQSVFVSQTSGGNPLLRDSERHQLRISATVKPIDAKDLTFTASYSRTRTDNPIASFPSPTPQIENAFPQRFMRDADGNLLSIDARPINFASSRSSQLRWGFNFSVPLKSHVQKLMENWRANGAKPEERPDIGALFGMRPGGQGRDGQGRDGQGQGGERRAGQDGGNRPQDEGQGREGGPPGGGEGAGPGAGPGGGQRGPGGGGPFGGPGGGGRGPGGGGGGGRLQFALFHTWHFTDDILIAPGIPRLDLLNGDAVASNGGQSRHEIQAQAGYFNNGLGARLSANWQSGTEVNGALGAANQTLHFSSLATADLRLFANIGQMPALVRNHPFLRGSRVSLSVTNLFNTRQTVNDGTGATPLRYQQGYLDPLGRTVMISFRKLFF